MKDNYHISLKEISLDEYEKILESKELLPGRIILKEDIHEKFNKIRSNDIEDLEKLLEQLNSKKKIKKFALDSGLNENYLTILRREIKSNLPHPVKLNSFPGVNSENIEILATMGIKNSKNLYNKVKNKEELYKLQNKTNIPLKELLEIINMSDLVRVSGVGPVFSRMIIDVGIESAKKMSEVDSKQLFKDLVKINIEKNYTKANFTQNDVEYCANFAKKLPKGFEY